MAQTHGQSRPVLDSAAAHLHVRDLEAAIDFFAAKPGFSVDWVYGEPPFYGQVRRDRALLALRSMDEAFFAEDIREWEGWFAHRSRWPAGRRCNRVSPPIRPPTQLLPRP